jgi:hypothetical protein
MAASDQQPRAPERRAIGSVFPKSLIYKSMRGWHDTCRRLVMRGDRCRADSFNKEPS